MSIGEIASLIAAIAFAILVIFSAIPLLKLGGVLDELKRSIREITAESLNSVQEASVAMGQVNTQLEKVDLITSSATRSVEDISALTTLVTATLGRPLIKLSAFSYAVRRAMNLDKKEGQQ